MIDIKNYDYNEDNLSPVGKVFESTLLVPRFLQFLLLEGKLNKFYDKVGIKDNEVKNHMRHRGGSALFSSRHWLGSPKQSKFWANLKESADIITNDYDDTPLDLYNNHVGRQITKQNPNAKSDELLQKVYESILRDMQNSNMDRTKK